MRVTPKEAPAAAAPADKGADVVAPASAAQAAVPAATKSGKATTGEILRSGAAKAAPEGRSRDSAPEGSKAKVTEESEVSNDGTTAEAEAAEQESEGADGKPSKSVRRRLRVANQAVNAAKEASAEVADLRAQVRLLTEHIAGKGAPVTQAKPAAIQAPKFSEPFPENGTDEQQNTWRVRKEVHETAAPIAKAMAEGIVSDQLRQYTELMSPILDDYVTKTRSTQVERARPKVEELGFDVDEVLTAARAIVAKNPQLPLQAAIGLVVFSDQDELVEAQKEEPKKVPSRAGRVVDSLSRKADPSKPSGVFGSAWRGRSNDMISVLKARAASKNR